jgi:hypothetical protein
MPCDRSKAIERLLALWAARTIEDETFGLRVSLADILAPEIIDIVVRDDLLAEHDLDRKLAELVDRERETQRQQEMIRPWLSPCGGRVQ